MSGANEFSVEDTPRVTVMTGHQPHFLPALGYFAKMRACDVFVYSDDVQYTRKEWQNRNRVWGYAHWQWLTVPVRATSGKRIVDMQLAPTPWRKDIIKRLAALLRKTPNYALIEPVLAIIGDERYTWLAELDIAIIEHLCNVLGITARRVRATELNCSGPVTLKLYRQMQATGCARYLSGPSGPSYMVNGIFTRDELRIHTWVPLEEKGWRATIQLIAEIPQLEDVWKVGVETVLPWTDFAHAARMPVASHGQLSPYLVAPAGSGSV